MPRRITPLVTGEIYHVTNRGVNHQPIFNDIYDYNRALELLSFYQFVKPSLRFSFYNRLPAEEKRRFLDKMKQYNQKLTTCLSFCLMPNHFHLLIKQESEKGISKLLSNFQNSFTRYFNTKHKRIGHLFQGQFKTVRIETEEQLLHTSRYIHLNPYTSYVVKSISDLEKYSWSSLREYIEHSDKSFCDVKTILSSFPSRKKYLEFVLDQKDYQRTLEKIKHLILEK